ncbi:hypothetical protein Tco_1248796 [Tanacetum coccineum]
MCFADDLLVMCHGDTTFVRVIKKALDAFSAYSGLLPNNSKSIVFFGSMNEDERDAISYVLPIWASVFLLPESVIKDINRLLKSFLWSQSETAKGKAKEIYVDNDDNWGWKNLLGITDQIKGNVIFYDERLNGGLKVYDLIVNGEWMWPIEWYDKFPIITSLAVLIVNADIEDKIMWRTNNGKEDEFSVSKANYDLNRKNPTVQW